MAQFRSESGNVIFENTRKRKLIKDGVEYKRVPRPKYKSRATRLSEACSVIADVADTLEGIAGQFTDYDPEFNTQEELDALLADMEAQFALIDVSDIEGLKEEIETWRDGMEGTNLEYSSKYDELTECFDALELGVDGLEGNEAPSTDGVEPDAIADELSNAIDEIRSGLDELECVCFPGMY